MYLRKVRVSVAKSSYFARVTILFVSTGENYAELVYGTLDESAFYLNFSHLCLFQSLFPDLRKDLHRIFHKYAPTSKIEFAGNVFHELARVEPAQSSADFCENLSWSWDCKL